MNVMNVSKGCTSVRGSEIRTAKSAVLVKNQLMGMDLKRYLCFRLLFSNISLFEESFTPATRIVLHSSLASFSWFCKASHYVKYVISV